MEIEKYLWLRGKSQGEIAEVLGISQGYLSEICAGKKDLPFVLLIPFAEIIEAPVTDVATAFHNIRVSWKRAYNHE